MTAPSSRPSAVELLAGLRGLTVRAPSPDGTVHALLGPHGSRVELADTTGRSPGALARQITAALAAAQRDYRDAILVLMGGQITTAPPGPLTTELETALAEVTAEAVSPLGLAVVRRHGATGVTVELRPDAPGHPRLAAELDAALHDADRAYARRPAT